MANITSVALADSHLLIRAGLACLLRELCAVNVVGLASNGREAVDLVAACRPQLVVAEAEMPVLNGLEATRNILRDFPGTRVLILSGFAGEDRILRALRAGAAGYIHKSASPSEFRLAIESVVRGEKFLSPVVSRHVIDAYLAGATERVSSVDQLTQRQREILQLVVEGHSSKQIAHILDASVKTIDSHRTNLMGRLGIRNIPGLVRYAISAGLISAN